MYLSAGTRGFDRHLLLTVLIQHLQIQFRRTFSDAKGETGFECGVDLLRQRCHEKKKRSDFFRAIYRRTPARRERSTLRAAKTVNRVKKKVGSVLDAQRKQSNSPYCGISQTFSRLKFL